MMVLPGANIHAGAVVAERVRAALGAALIDHVGRVTARFGVATMSAGESIEELVKRADEGLYTAKESGRDRVVAQ